MTINLSQTRISVELITQNGAIFGLNHAVQDIQWGEHPNDIAQKANLTLANGTVGKQKLIAICKLGCTVRVYGNWSGKDHLLFDGVITDWSYGSGSEQTLSVIACDPLHYLQRSQDVKYYVKGRSTQQLLEKIIGKFTFPKPYESTSIDYRWDKSITHGKKIFDGLFLSDMVFDVLNEVRRKTGEKFLLLFREGKIVLCGYGTNKNIFAFTHENTISTHNRLTTDEMINRVKIIGKANKWGKSPTEAVVNGDNRQGWTLQAVVHREDDQNIFAAKADAQTLLKERGSPTEDIQITVPDLPFLRKGDRICVKAGNLDGDFFVEGVSHNATQKIMELTCSRV